MKSKLQEILEDMFAEAKAKAGQKVVRKLGRGLRIEMICVNSGATSAIWLAITRDDTFPSLKEWETVTNNFPYQVPKVEPASDRSGGRYSISARFALARTVQMKFF